MPRFKKEILRPGRYLQQGRWVNVSPDDVQTAFNSINQLADKELVIPLMFEHIPPSDDQIEGIPATLDEMKASELKRTVGFIAKDSAKMTDQCTLEVEFEVPDVDAAKQLDSKLIKFVSPELRPNGWTHKKTGKHFDNVFSHVALTHTPIQCDQAAGFETVALSDLEGVFCFSAQEVEDFVDQEPIQFADHAFEKKKPNPGNDSTGGQQEVGSAEANGNVDGEGGQTPPTPPAVPPVNPDMPKGGADQDAEKMQAILAHLNNQGIALPADTDQENFFDRMLTALMTVEASKAKLEEEKTKEHVNPDDQEVDEATNHGMMQYSDFEDRSKLAARVVKAFGQGKIPSKTRDQLLLQVGTVQFSDDGKEVSAGIMSVGEILTLAESSEGVFSAGSPQLLIRNRITQLSSGNDAKILPAMADELLEKIGSLQFSDGEEVAAGSGVRMTDLLDIYERQASMTTILLSDISGDDYAGFGISQESPDKQFSDGTERVGDKEAVSIVDRMAENNPGMLEPVAGH